jgi:hypothetical protein
MLPRSTCAIEVEEQMTTTKAKANFKTRLAAEDASMVPPFWRTGVELFEPM